MAEAMQIHQVGAVRGAECYVLRCDDGKIALVDAGFAYCAPQTYENIMQATDGKPVDYLLLTHSHYDHVAAAGYLKQRMPAMRLAAHPHAARVLARSGALATMRRLNANAAHKAGLQEFEDVPENLTIDILLTEESVIDLDTAQLQVMEAPGHTRDCLAFWDAEHRLLVACETMGVYGSSMPHPVPALPDGSPAPEAGDVSLLVSPACLVGYGSALDFIARASALDPQTLIISHAPEIYYGAAARAYIKAADYWNRYAAAMVCVAHDNGETDEQIIARFKQLFYTPWAQEGQPEMAFDLNASYTVPLILNELR